VGFGEFFGNERIVAALRGMLREGRVPHAMLFSGPRGVGKFTLARMFAQAANCDEGGDEFCGKCAVCVAIGRLANPQPLVEQALEERGESADAATVERVPLLLQPHPDVCAVVPDPVRLRNPVARPVIRMGQLRAVQRAAYFRPAARRRVFIVDGAETMRYDFANVFLKILEEPPESATLILLAPNAYQLLPTIQSRCLRFYFAAVSSPGIEEFLAQRRAHAPAKRKLIAQLAGGSVGLALEMNLEESERLRRLMLRILELGLSGRDFSSLFAETSQAAKNEQESFEKLLELLYSLLTDLLELSQGLKVSALRNPDLRRELEGLSKNASPGWISRAASELDMLHARMRRNINRQLGLDAFALSLGPQ
jgi:DNA polymerase-3 subunit delta'